MSLKFVNNVETASFEEVQFVSGAPRRKKEGPTETEMDDDELEAMRVGAMAEFQRKDWTRPGQEAPTEEGGPGFLVIMEGYSPYAHLGDLIDPLGVENAPAKWGLATRLLHLADANGPFELYKKTEAKHFNLEIGEVDLESEKRPAGIGVAEYLPVAETGRSTLGIKQAEAMLIDPMTKETISKVIELDEDGQPKTDRAGRIVYQMNDHWFVFKLKFLWKEAPTNPDVVSAAGGAAMRGRR
jgi:hypothetical protein